jgi:hypothetical protein
MQKYRDDAGVEFLKQSGVTVEQVYVLNFQ